MTVLENTLEAGVANGTAMTNANSDISGDPFAVVGSVLFSSAYKMHGALGANTESVAAAKNFGWTWTADGKLALRFYLQIHAAPTVTKAAAAISNSAGFIAGVNVRNDRRLNFAAGGSGINVGASFQVSNTILALDTWYRIEIVMSAGASISTGEMSVRLFPGDSATALESYTRTDLNLGTTGFTGVKFGQMDSSGNSSFQFDSIKAVTGGTTFPGPFTPATGTVYPIAEVANDGFTEFGAAGGRLAALSDSDSSTGIRSVDDPTNDWYVVQLAALTSGLFPQTTVDLSSPAGDGNIEAVIQIRQGPTTVIAERTVAQVTTYVDPYTFTMTNAEKAAITDYANLHVAVKFNKVV